MNNLQEPNKKVFGIIVNTREYDRKDIHKATIEALDKILDYACKFYTGSSLVLYISGQEYESA